MQYKLFIYLFTHDEISVLAAFEVFDNNSKKQK